MTVSTTFQNYDSITTKMLNDTDTNATVKNNVMLSNTTLYTLQIKNDGAGTPTNVYFKMWDSKDPEIGTDEPDYIIMVPASENRSISLPGGLVFSNGLSYACTKIADVDDTTDPDTTVQVIMTME